MMEAQEQLAYEIQLTKLVQLKRFINNSDRCPSREAFQQIVRSALDGLGMDSVALARELNTSRNTVDLWAEGKAAPIVGFKITHTQKIGSLIESKIKFLRFKLPGERYDFLLASQDGLEQDDGIGR